MLTRRLFSYTLLSTLALIVAQIIFKPAIRFIDLKVYHFIALATQNNHLLTISAAFISNLLDPALLLIVMVMLSIGFSIKQRTFLPLSFAFFACLAGLSSTVLKLIVHEPRPLTMLIHENGYSFPSGHSTMAAFALITLILLLHRQFTGQAWLPIVLTALVLLLFALGLSRLILQVHYLFDILCGMSLGSCLAIMNYSLYTDINGYIKAYHHE